MSEVCSATHLTPMQPVVHTCLNSIALLAPSYKMATVKEEPVVEEEPVVNDGPEESEGETLVSIKQELDELMAKLDSGSELGADLGADLEKVKELTEKMKTLAEMADTTQTSEPEQRDGGKAGYHLGKNHPHYTRLGSNHNLLIGSPFYCKSSALDHVTTKAGLAEEQDFVDEDKPTIENENRPTPPWWTLECRKAINARRNAMRSFSKNATQENLENFRKMRHEARNVIRQAQEIWKVQINFPYELAAAAKLGEKRAEAGGDDADKSKSGPDATNKETGWGLAEKGFTHCIRVKGLHPRYIKV
ncbi:unnamed protein product [Timema podura]|uniref:Uncharacterized protein n=1 Tax=Timema podura TaxID=61482 RepID=A0ABN7NW13_TIMPD|nr:unnamed protein product [Timema podura]